MKMDIANAREIVYVDDLTKSSKEVEERYVRQLGNDELSMRSNWERIVSDARHFIKGYDAGQESKK